VEVRFRVVGAAPTASQVSLDGSNLLDAAGQSVNATVPPPLQFSVTGAAQ
jgi:hypothetical protein